MDSDNKDCDTRDKNNRDTAGHESNSRLRVVSPSAPNSADSADFTGDDAASTDLAGAGNGSGLIVARGTGDGLVIRIDGRIGESSLLQALRSFVSARRTFLENNQVALEWVGQRPAPSLEEETLRMLMDEFSVHVRQSALLRESLPKSSASADVSRGGTIGSIQPEESYAQAQRGLAKELGADGSSLGERSYGTERARSKVTPFPLRRSRDAVDRDAKGPRGAGGLPDAGHEYSDQDLPEEYVGDDSRGTPAWTAEPQRGTGTKSSTLFDGLGGLAASPDTKPGPVRTTRAANRSRYDTAADSDSLNGATEDSALASEERHEMEADYSKVVAAALAGAARAEVVDRSVIGIDAAAWDDPDARVVFSTLRSGQKLESEHSLVIFGDVNSGAEVVAGGDIVVLGVLRGVAHAGAYDESGGGRIIYAQNLQPTQLRIGTVISRGSAEASHTEGAGSGPEVARVEGSLIVVEPYLSRNNAMRVGQRSRDSDRSSPGRSGGRIGRRGIG